MAATDWLPIGVAALVVAAIFGAYALGRGSSRSSASRQGLHQIRQYVPPVVVELGYRNETGIRTQRRVAVLKCLCHDDGRLYLLGVSGSRQPRTFRVDRIVQVATPDGEVMGTRQFLTDWLSIPPKMLTF